jgi:hypothetical protein
VYENAQKMAAYADRLKAERDILVEEVSIGHAQDLWNMLDIPEQDYPYDDAVQFDIPPEHNDLKWIFRPSDANHDN